MCGIYISFKRLFYFMNIQLMKRKSESVWEKSSTKVADLIHFFSKYFFYHAIYDFSMCVFHSFTDYLDLKIHTGCPTWTVTKVNECCDNVFRV